MSKKQSRFDPLQIDLAAFIGLLAVLPLVSIGTTSGLAPLWWLGLALLCVGSATTLTTKFAFDDNR